MSKKYSETINRIHIHIHIFRCCTLMFMIMAQQLFALPLSLERVVRILEGQNKQKSVKLRGDKVSSVSLDDVANNPQSTELYDLSNAQQAKLVIDEVIKDSKVVQHPATWYYRGVIYDRLLRDCIYSKDAPILLSEALAAYERAKKLSLSKHKQFHNFTITNLAALWCYILNRGISYYRQEAFEQAIDQFTICRRILPEESTPLLYTAIVYHIAEQPQKALRYYQDYLTVQGPHFVVARAMAAIYYQNFRNFDKALAILNEALLQFPFNNELLEEKCLIYETSGRVDDYVASLAVGVQKKEINASYEYAYLMEYLGRTQEAIAFYQNVLKEYPNQYDTIRQIGFLFYNEAIKLSTNALKLVSQKEQLDNPTLANWLGLMHVTVKCVFPHVMRWEGIDCAEHISKMTKTHPFSSRLIWVVYDHPLIRNNRVPYLHHLMEAEGGPSYISSLYGFIHTKSAIALVRNRWTHTITELKKCLNKSLHYLIIAHSKNKKDKAVAQALYYNYYHLKKYGSAYKLLQTMRKLKQYLEGDPFIRSEERQ